MEDVRRLILAVTHDQAKADQAARNYSFEQARKGINVLGE